MRQDKPIARDEPTYEIKSLSRRDLPRHIAGAAANDIADCAALAEEVWGEAAKDDDTGQLAFSYLYRWFGAPRGGYDLYNEMGAYCLTTPDPEVWLVIRCIAGSAPLGVSYIATARLIQEHRRPMAEWEQKVLGWLAEQLVLERPDIVTARDELGEPTAITDEGWRIVQERRMSPGPDSWGPMSWTGRAVAAIGQSPHTPARRWREGTEAQRRVNEALIAALRALLEPAYVRDVGINILGRVGRTPRTTDR